MRSNHIERRVEYASDGFRRGAARRQVQMPGETRHQITSEDPATIAREIQQQKLERRARR